VLVFIIIIINFDLVRSRSSCKDSFKERPVQQKILTKTTQHKSHAPDIFEPTNPFSERPKTLSIQTTIQYY